jgi:hypothetical protein
LAGSTSKRVVLYCYDRQPVEGIVSPGAYLLDSGVELLSLQGAVVVYPYQSIKALCFVNEFGDPKLFSQHNLFDRRPRVPGLWTRFTFHDGDQLDGILPHNLLEWPSEGYTITPPHATGSRQRVFIPRDSLRLTELRGVVGVSLVSSTQPGMPRKRQPGRTAPESQLNMFTD